MGGSGRNNQGNEEEIEVSLYYWDYKIEVS